MPDVPSKSLQLDLTPTKLVFTGTSESKKTAYHVELEFYAEIDPANSKTHHTAANIQMVLRKKELKEEYWPRLLKDSKKAHFLRTDFDKWVDQDEQNEAPEDDYMNQFGGMGEDGGFGGIDFSKLGGGAGGDMPGMEGLGGGDDDEDDEDDDEEMPDLADPEDDKAAAGKGKSKIEEINESK